MKSVKLGRGPSFMTGIASLAIGILGIFWMIGAASMGGGFFALFGLVFVLIAISQAIYSFKNATSKNRFSALDITDDNEEIDPLNIRFGNTPAEKTQTSDSEDKLQVPGNQFCPYCGIKLDSVLNFVTNADESYRNSFFSMFVASSCIVCLLIPLST